MSDETATNPVTVSCSKCRHAWIGLYLPQSIADAAKIMKRLTCPKCACTKIYLHNGSVKL